MRPQNPQSKIFTCTNADCGWDNNRTGSYHLPCPKCGSFVRQRAKLPQAKPGKDHPMKMGYYYATKPENKKRKVKRQKLGITAERIEAFQMYLSKAFRECVTDTERELVQEMKRNPGGWL